VLDDWGAWKSGVSEGVGWNVSPLAVDRDFPRGIQRRNDTYSDPVAAEYSLLERNERLMRTVDSAWRGLGLQGRRLIYIQHRIYPRASQSEVAARIGLAQTTYSKALGQAYSRIEAYLRVHGHHGRASA
jgi:hypothetical protein